MSSAAILQTLAPGAIDLDDTTYLLRPDPGPPNPSLVDSIADLGLLQPPLLHNREDGCAVILSGRQRIAAAALLGLAGIPVLVLPAATPLSRRLELLAEHARIGSELSIIEQATLMNKAEQWLSEQECLDLLARLGHRPVPHVLRELTSLLELEKTAVLALHRQKLHPRAGRKLARLKAGDQREIVRLITALRLGGSRQQKLVDMATELIMRQNRAFGEIVGEMEKKIGWQVREENIPQQAAALLQWLHGQCFPRSEAAAADFRRFCRRLELPTGVRIRHTPAFEDDRLTLEIDFRNRQELLQRWPQILNILETGAAAAGSDG